MTYREALFFVGKCLTLGHYPTRIGEVREVIRSGSVAWEQIVWVSTSQYVFPAVYLQLKRAGLLEELPTALVEYMEEYTDVNRERNKQIIDQAREIAALLNPHEINLVFLKGTGYLLDGLYEDIAERMVGDIDLLVDEKDMVRAAEVLISNGYGTLEKFYPLDLNRNRHYPSLANSNYMAGVEIHRQIIRVPYQNAVDFELIATKSRKLNQLDSAYVPGNEHQILYNILNFQLNDESFYYASVFFRQMYDLFLLSMRENPLTVVRNFGSFFNCMNANLAASNMLLGDPVSISYQHDWHAKIFLKRINRHINHPGWARFSHSVLHVLLVISNTIRVVIAAISNQGVRRSVYAHLRDPKWYGTLIESYKKVY